MNSMEHMRTRWVPAKRDDGSWIIDTDESSPWAVCEVAAWLPGDRSGELTARAICDAHNAALPTNSATPPKCLPEKVTP